MKIIRWNLICVRWRMGRMVVLAVVSHAVLSCQFPVLNVNVLNSVTDFQVSSRFSFNEITSSCPRPFLFSGFVLLLVAFAFGPGLGWNFVFFFRRRIAWIYNEIYQTILCGNERRICNVFIPLCYSQCNGLPVQKFVFIFQFERRLVTPFVYTHLFHRSSVSFAHFFLGTIPFGLPFCMTHLFVYI